MKKNIILTLNTLFLTLFHFSSIQAQGYSDIYNIQVGETSYSNEVVSTIPYQNESLLSVTLFYNGNNFVPGFTQAFSNGAFPGGASNPDPANDNNHIPVSILAAETGEYTYVLTNSINNENSIAVHITQYEHGETTNEFPNIPVWTTPQISDSQNNVKGADFQIRPNGSFISLGMIQSEISSEGENLFDIFLVAANSEGVPQWSETYQSLGDDIPVAIITNEDSTYSILFNKEDSGNKTLHILQVDNTGTIVSQIPIDQATGFTAYDIIKSADDNLILTGENADENLFVLKINAAGNTIWSQEYIDPNNAHQGRGIMEDLTGAIVVAGRIKPNTTTEHAYIVKLTADGTPLWERPIIRDENSGFNNVLLTSEGKYHFTGYADFTSVDEIVRGSYNARTDTFGIIKGGQISGNVFFDEMTDCINVDELDLENWIVQAQKDTLFFYANTDEFGNYSIPVDIESGETAEYTVSVFPASDYWMACENDIVVSIPYLDSTEVNFPMQAIITCPFVETQITDGGIRPCESATFYVSYCNTGTSIAEDATIKVTLDEYLTYESASITPAGIDGQSLTFSLGDLDINTCGEFSFNAFTDCDSVMIDDVLCLELNVSPDTICDAPLPANWSGALLQASAECDEDNITFKIENTGTGGMALAQEYIIIEDAVLLMQDNFDLGPGENKITNQFPINGSTYHIIAPQEPGAPGAPILSIGTVDCINNSGQLFNEIAQNNGDPFNIIYCPVVVGSFDPNDKQATPSGIGEENFISPNTDIEYRIRFQNTGTDTAFRVVLRDTLSQFLDPATIVPGTSSHDYEWNLNDRGHLTFNFYNIELPDSLTNPAASQGFVNFKIRQKENLEDYTVIENSAGIYFDFNEPIITNIAMHTVLELVNIDIVNGTVTTALPKMQVSVSPNPMRDGAWLSIDGLEIANQSLQATLFDMTGKAVYNAKSEGEQIWIARENLLPGIYFFSIENADGWLASGKLIVQ